MRQDAIDRLVPRLNKIGIEVVLIGNYPWIYLESVNGNRIKEEDYFFGNHGFAIALLPLYGAKTMEILDIRKTFKMIRKYK